MASTEQKLSKVFTESFQIKRLTKQISDMKELREKGHYDVRMTLIKTECLVFKVDVLLPAYKSTKVPEMYQIIQEVRLVVRDTYPAQPPKLFFLSDNMSKIGIQPFRDYFPQILGELQWSAKVTICQIIKSLPNFIESHLKNVQNPEYKHPIISFNEYFELDSLFSWKFVQVHPIRMIKAKQIKQGLMVINVPLKEIIFLVEAALETSYRNCDYIQGHEIQSLRKKTSSNRLLLEVKLQYSKMKGKFGIQFYSQDYDALLMGVMDCAKSTIVENDQPKSRRDSDSSSSDEDAEGQKQALDEAPTNISQIQEGIVVYESLVDSNMTSENISQLVLLLKKAIEYYSASSDDRFRIYLQKLQSILANQMAQVLLESADEERDKKQKPSRVEQINKEEDYNSVIDLL